MAAVPSPATLLAVWEQAHGRPQTDRARALLRLTDESATDAQLASLTIGDADRRLLELRAATFGDRFDAICRCPRCRESIALDFRSADFADASNGVRDRTPLRVLASGYEIDARLPTIDDLARIAEARNADAARDLLVRRCVTGVRQVDGESVDPAAIPPDAVTAVARALEGADPLASTRFELRCPACDHAWSTAFDVFGYFWAELDAWAPRLLREVHVIASAYGWSESEILGLSSRRRRQYLELIVA